MAGEVFISIDMEADGPIPGDYSMQSIGAVVVGRPDKTFYIELKPISENYDPVASSIGQNQFGESFTREYLQTYGKDPKEAMEEFANWIKEVSQDQRPVFVAYPAGFDFTWIHWYMIHFLGKDPFGINALDMRSFFMGAFKNPYWNSNKQKMKKLFPPSSKHTHNALDDAIEQSEIFEGMLQKAMNP
jgi:hypothetical protein